jgi:hypothetical protein
MLSYTVAAVTPADALAYVTARALTGWPGSEPAQVAALRRGQDHVAREYNGQWLEEFTDATAPELVKFAVVEAALVEARAPGSLSPTVKASEAKMLTGVGSITWTPIKGPAGVDALRPRLLHVEAMLAGLVSGGSTRMLERA